MTWTRARARGAAAVLLAVAPRLLPAGARTLTLPDNDKIRVMAISVAETNPQVKPAQPLYDTLVH